MSAKLFLIHSQQNKSQLPVLCLLCVTPLLCTPEEQLVEQKSHGAGRLNGRLAVCRGACGFSAVLQLHHRHAHKLGFSLDQGLVQWVPLGIQKGFLAFVNSLLITKSSHKVEPSGGCQSEYMLCACWSTGKPIYCNNADSASQYQLPNHHKQEYGCRGKGGDLAQSVVKNIYLVHQNCCFS